MYRDSKILAVIPARGGSKGVPRKNIRQVHGKPLLAWTAEAALASKYLDEVVLSSEDAQILETGKSLGLSVPYVRPQELAEDTTTAVEVALDVISNVRGYDHILLLQPTSPLRTTKDIDTCIQSCLDSGSPSCVSVAEPDKSPFWMYTVGDNGTLEPLLDPCHRNKRRQDLPPVYVPNGALYLSRIDAFLASHSFITADTIPYCMPKIRSLDLDTEQDFAMLEFLLKHDVLDQFNGAT